MARKRCKYKCFQLLQSARVASNHAIYMVFCGCPAKEPRKNLCFLKCLGFQNGRKMTKHMEIFCRKGFFWLLEASQWLQTMGLTRVCAPSLSAAAHILRVTKKMIAEKGEEKQSWEIAFGAPWTTETFIQEATNRGHPTSLFEGLAPMVVDAIHSSPTRDPAAIARKRASFLKKWTTRPAQLTKDEEELHSSLPKHRRLILRGKRILVLKEMLAELQYPDLSVADDILNGFDLVGTAGAEGVLPADFQPATLTVQDLEEQANKSNKAIMNSCKSSGSPLVDAELWQKTLEEEDKGWLQSLERVPLDGGRVSRRFAVVQSEKVRPIDNYSESQINSAVTITNKCTVDGVDTKPAKTCEFMKALRSRSKCSTLVGRSFDLKSAYRQLAVSDSDLKWARLAVYCPEEKATKCFQQYSLPFGAKSSVVALLRCARMLQWICLKLDLVTSCYFDDFICLSTPALSRSSELTFETLLDLLGWKFDETGEKSSAMGASISALGVIVDLEKSSEGVVQVQNTEKMLVPKLPSVSTKAYSPATVLHP